MSINKKLAFQIWEKHYGDALWAEDFHGNLMFKNAYGDENYCVCNRTLLGTIYCGWNIHHVFPKGRGGTDDENNLICTNIATNRAAADDTTFWIDNILYQVQRGQIVAIKKWSKEDIGQPPYEIVKFPVIGRQYKEHAPFDSEWQAFINRGCVRSMRKG